MSEIRCKICNKEFGNENSLKQHVSAKHSSTSDKEKINWRRYVVFGLIGMIILFFVMSVSSYVKKPGEYNEFAQCLTDKGVIVYGNDFCQYTAKQLNFFGKSKKYLNYVKCIENKELCDSKGVDTTPTWEINGKMYEQVQSLERLKELSGC